MHTGMCGELTSVLLSLGPLKIGALLERNLNLKKKSQGGELCFFLNETNQMLKKIIHLL
jgi:hypothetical protein